MDGRILGQSGLQLVQWVMTRSALAGVALLRQMTGTAFAAVLRRVSSAQSLRQFENSRWNDWFTLTSYR